MFHFASVMEKRALAALVRYSFVVVCSAVFQGDVFAQDVNRYGFRWRLDAQTGYTFMNEIQLSWNHRDEECGLPGQMKTGAWFQSGESADALAQATGSGDSGYHAILDQLFYREPASAEMVLECTYQSANHTQSIRCPAGLPIHHRSRGHVRNSRCARDRLQGICRFLK